MKRIGLLIGLGFAVVVSGTASAATPAPRQASALDTANAAVKPKAYDDFVKGATVTAGLLPIVRKDGALYLVLAKTAIDSDFILTAVPSTGLGGFGPAAGEPYVAPARIIRFERHDDRIALRYPNRIALADPKSPESAGVLQSLPASVVDVEPIVAEDSKAGTVVVSAKAFLGDIANFDAVFSQQIKNPAHGYHLDPARSFFLAEKAFPGNDTLRVAQTWSSADPDLIDVAPDARSVEVDITYNIVAVPEDGYMPRIADPRVGYFAQPFLDFHTDDLPHAYKRTIYYLSRWNFAPKTPGTTSDAGHQLVFTIASNVPLKYRDTIKSALLAWNPVLAKAGITNAVAVQDQPDGADFDTDDLRNNMVRWIDTAEPQYGAEALIVNDPRTGEEINVGINVDAVEGTDAEIYRFLVAPARGLPNDPKASERFLQDSIRSTVLHESGHDLGLQHNFIGSLAYTAKNLQSMDFTRRFGVTSSVMEYAPVNLWPRGTPQGEYWQTVVGPYDDYAIHFGYANVPGATSPDAELPTLDRWASHWTDPVLRFASDEDTEFTTGHAIDPRVQTDDLTDHPLVWCDTTMQMTHGLMNGISARFPASGEPWDVAGRAFTYALASYGRCTALAATTIGGEYLSRARRGDAHGGAPLSLVPRSENLHAWRQLETGLFSDAAWHFNPQVLNGITYSEFSTFANGKWAYDPLPEHGVPVAAIAANYQERALTGMFAPLTLTRLDSFALKYPAGATMSLSDLFDWSQKSIFGNLRDGSVARDGVVRRNLQMRYARRLAKMWLSPAPGTPSDARALARFSLEKVSVDARAGAHAPRLPDIARAQLEALAAVATQALDARGNVPL